MRLKSHYRCSRCALLTPNVFPREGQLLCTSCLAKSVLLQVNNVLEQELATKEVRESATIIQFRPRVIPSPAP